MWVLSDAFIKRLWEQVRWVLHKIPVNLEHGILLVWRDLGCTGDIVAGNNRIGSNLIMDRAFVINIRVESRGKCHSVQGYIGWQA